MKLSIKKDFLFYLVSAIPVSLIVGLRGDTRDTKVYYEIFKNISNYDLLLPIDFYQITGVEILFGWYSQIISLFSSSASLMFFWWSFSIFVFLYLISKRADKNALWTFLLYVSSGYFVIWQFMQIRQGLAVVLALYSIVFFLQERKCFLFLFLALLSIATHQVAGVIVLCGLCSILFTHQNKMSITQFKIFSVFLFLAIVIFNKFIIINMLAFFSERVLLYSEYSAGTEAGLRLPDVKALLTFLILLLFTSQKIYQDRVYKIFFLLFVIGVACRIGFWDVPILSGRFASALTFTEIFLLPIIFLRFKKFGIYLLLSFIIIQAIAVYGFQVPEDFYQSYFYPYEN